MDAKQTRDDKQTRTMKRLVKKLSALRHTLSKSERELLDTLILGAPAEVMGHAIPGAVPGAIPGAVPGAIPGAVPGAIPGAVPGRRIKFDAAKNNYVVSVD